MQFQNVMANRSMGNGQPWHRLMTDSLPSTVGSRISLLLWLCQMVERDMRANPTLNIIRWHDSMVKHDAGWVLTDVRIR